MYLLSYMDSVMGRAKFQERIIRNQGYLESSTELDYLQLAQRLDPDFRPQKMLPRQTRGILEQLQGREGAKDYYRFQDPLERMDPELMLNTARAMVLADRGYGLLDELCASLLEATFNSAYPGLRAYCFAMASSLGGYSWQDLVRGPLASYFLPGRDLIALDGTRRELPSGLVLKHGKETVALGFRALPGRGIHWAPRGLSRLKSSHINLVEKLNQVMVDYDDRLKRMDEYLTGPRNAGITSEEERELAELLRMFKGCDLTGLAPGKSFGDSPIYLDRTHRGFHVRCESCGAPVELQIVRGSDSLSDEDWKNRHRSVHLTTYYSQVSNRLAEIHSSRGCSGTTAVSSRTGEQITISVAPSRRTSVGRV